MILTQQKQTIVYSDGASQESIAMTLEGEVWKDIPSYEGYYQVSNLGRVKSLDRIIIRSNNVVYSSKGKLIALCRGKKKYLIVRLCKMGVDKTAQVHQLVAFVFLGHAPCRQKLVVNHRDFNTVNNNVNNLEIITTRENTNQRHCKSTSQYTGVCWDKNRKKWRAAIKINGKTKNLGLFNVEEDAAEAYKKQLKQVKECY